MEGVWRVYGGCMEGVWRVCGGCVEGVWRVCGGCMEGVWRVCGGCMEGGPGPSRRPSSVPFWHTTHCLFQMSTSNRYPKDLLSPLIPKNAVESTQGRSAAKPQPNPPRRRPRPRNRRREIENEDGDEDGILRRLRVNQAIAVQRRQDARI